MHQEKARPWSLIGRDVEIQQIMSLIDGIAEQGTALVVRGEAGIGKSALLALVIAQVRAHGMGVLIAQGVQSEAQLPFAGLHQLVRPILARTNELLDTQREALLAAFGLSTAPAPEFLLIAMAALDLLTTTAEHTPLVLLIEDVQWLDQPTCDLLAFVARRLGPEPIILLMSLRDGFESMLSNGMLPELHLKGLNTEASATLLARCAAGLAPVVRTRLLKEAEGNPLALIELPLALTDEQLRGAATLPEVLPLTTRLERAFGARIAQLPETTRTLLLIAALDDGESLAELFQATALLDGMAATEEALEPAIGADLLVVADQTFAFRHPLVRSAIVQRATVARRHAAHAALARVLGAQPDRQIWHLAASRLAPDDDMATELEAAATRAHCRGAHAGAIAALERAAQFTSSSVLRGDRLVRAATLAFEQGRPKLGMHLLHQAEPLEIAPEMQTWIAWLMEAYGASPMWSGTTKIATFVALADQARAEGNVGRALSLLMAIALRGYWSHLEPQTRGLIIITAERIPVPEDDARLLFILALAAPLERGASVIERFARLPFPAASDPPELAQMLSLATSAVGDFIAAARLAAIGIEGQRIQGQPGLLAQLLVTQAFTTFYLGAWNVTLPAAAEAGRLAEETEQPRWEAMAHLFEAMLAALRGEQTRAEALTDDAEQMLLLNGANPLRALVQQARGLCALAEGRYAAAFDHLHRMFVSTDSAYHPVICCWALADLVEAAVHSGHEKEVHAVVSNMEQLGAATQFPYLQMNLLFARPLLAAEDHAEALFQTALLAENMAHYPFLRARLHLAYGAWLRRQRRVAESRAPLRTAIETFDALRAQPWGARARQELRASGETNRHRVPEARSQLSPQELQIAQLAAVGLSNREIGQRIFLSHRTVGFHLYRIFPKLGITSRAELRAALGNLAFDHP